MTRADATRMARRAGNVGARHPETAARFYRRASTLFHQVGDHTAARDCDEAAEAHDAIARQHRRREAS